MCGLSANTEEENNTSNKSNAGKSYVIFGKQDNTAINLSAIATGTGGFVINGHYSHTLTHH
jgi:hypothetical protein